MSKRNNKKSTMCNIQLRGLIVLCCVLAALGCDKKTQYHRTYLGQEVPGLTAVRFAPEILTNDNQPHSRLSISPNHNALYWSAYVGQESMTIGLLSKFDGKKLSKPEPKPFSEELDIRGPVFNSDGNRIFFSGVYPVPELDDKPHGGIWYVQNTGGLWGDPVPVIATMDSLWQTGSPAISRNGNLYFSAVRMGELAPKLYFSEHANEEYSTPQELGEAINSGVCLDPFVSPDENFLLFVGHDWEGGHGSGDIFISFKDADSSWGDPVNLGLAVNSENFERFPSVSPNGKYIFFLRATSSSFPSDSTHFYWVDSEILNSLRH